ncbi:MAG: DUF4234 domain-containing protein [Clostridiales Family XIII bacterium]|jgi:hypothetical protein|nr:DUF4234 domain-containing protein [Clostridiales Family XIII bacterium]
MIEQRGLLKLILLSIVTLGIYWLYWIHRLARDTNTLCYGDGRQTSGLLIYILLGIVTFGIYNLVWWYMVAERLRGNAPRYGLVFNEGGLAFLLWYILGSLIVVGPFVAIYLLIRNINALADRFNAGVAAMGQRF